jgi:hypothetical protein
MDWATITRELMEQKDWAWAPVTTYLAVTGFIVFNLIIAVVCDAVSMVGVANKEMTAKEQAKHRVQHTPQQQQQQQQQPNELIIPITTTSISNHNDMEHISDLLLPQPQQRHKSSTNINNNHSMIPETPANFRITSPKRIRRSSSIVISSSFDNSLMYDENIQHRMDGLLRLVSSLSEQQNQMTQHLKRIVDNNNMNEAIIITHKKYEAKEEESGNVCIVCGSSSSTSTSSTTTTTTSQ